MNTKAATDGVPIDLSKLFEHAVDVRSRKERSLREARIYAAFEVPRADPAPVVVLVRRDAARSRTSNIDSQLELINRYLEACGLHNRATFGSRPDAAPEEQFEELIAFPDRNDYVNKVIVADPASLAGSASLAVENSRRIESRGCEVVSVR